MEETTYLRDKTVLVTSTRIELNGQTYAVRNVGSVKVTQPGTPWLAGFVAIVGIAMLAGGSDTRWVGVLVLGGAGVWIYQQVRMRRLVIVSGGGETVALKSTNGAMIEKIRSAVAQAISAR